MRNLSVSFRVCSIIFNRSNNYQLMVMLITIALLSVLWTVCNAAIPIWSPNTGCGKSKYSDAGNMYLPGAFIVGGQTARSYEFPWQVSISARYSNGHFCGGAIISTRWVVTAAHCLEGETTSSLWVVAGEWSRASASSVRQTINAQHLISHPNYNKRTLDNDIALIKLTKDIIFNDNVQPVCAPDSAKSYTHLKAVASGWGTLSSGGSCCPDTLRYVTLNVTTNQYCISRYPSYYSITSGNLCASDNRNSNERDACQGDSGGPLAVKEADGTFRLVGVVSWGVGCASGYPGVYARVTYFNSWISNTIARY